MMKKAVVVLLAVVMVLGMVPGMAEEPGVELPGGDIPAAETAVTVMHNIAGEYAGMELDENDGNLPWILADMAVYRELFPESENNLTSSVKEDAMKMMAAFLETATKPGDLAKGILALRSLGYDARNIYTAEFEKLDAVAKLTELVDAEDAEVTKIYALPYVILALGQGEGYATEEQMEWLIQKALDSKIKMLWQTTEDPEYGYVGTDAMTPMLLALAPYCDVNPELGAAVNETVENLKAEQREDGLIDGYEGYEPASTGLAICAFSALGMDAETIAKGGKTLVEGLLSAVNENQNGFANVFATEQGFRGLLAWQLLTRETGKTMYDFLDYDMAEANVPGTVGCPVFFETNPVGAKVTLEGKEAFAENRFDLAEGVYTYIATMEGYLPESGTVTVSAREAAEHQAKTIPISLTKLQGVVGGLPSGTGTGSGISSGVGTGTGGGFSGGGSAGTGEVVGDPVSPPEEELPEAQTPAIMVMNGDTFPDVKESDWYFTAVKYVFENSLFQGTEAGFEPNEAMSRAMLVTVLHRLETPETLAEKNPFFDVPENQWYTEGVKWAAENGIVSGVSETLFDPDAGITREQLAVILYRYALFCGYETAETDLTSFEDAHEVSDYAEAAIRYAVAKGIMGGKTENTLAPRDGATRAEVAAVLMRFSQLAR